jgi:hypothetical protein
MRHNRLAWVLCFRQLEDQEDSTTTRDGDPPLIIKKVSEPAHAVRETWIDSAIHERHCCRNRTNGPCMLNQPRIVWTNWRSMLLIVLLVILGVSTTRKTRGRLVDRSLFISDLLAAVAAEIVSKASGSPLTGRPRSDCSCY